MRVTPAGGFGPVPKSSEDHSVLINDGRWAAGRPWGAPHTPGCLHDAVFGISPTNQVLSVFADT